MRTRSLVALAGLACGLSAAQAQSLQTTFAGGNTFAGNTFNLTAAKPLTIIGFDTNISNLTAFRRNESVSLYYRNGTAVGFENNAGAWAFFGTDTSVSNQGEGNPSLVNLSGLEFAPGQLRGMYVDLASYLDGTNQINYTNSAGPTNYANGDFTITSNSGQGSPAFVGSTFPNRIWNGRVYYKPTAACVPLTTTFISNNGQAGNTFNLVALNPITITSFDMNFEVAGSNKIVAVYYKLGPAQGSETNAAAWTLLGRDTNVISSGAADPARVKIGGLALTPGQVYGIYVDVETSSTTGGLNYTNGSATYGNADLRFSSNTGQGSPAFVDVYSPRIWNGNIYYAPTPTIESLTTQFAQNNGLDGAMFDVTPQKDIEIDGFDVSVDAGTQDIVVYYKSGTSFGFETNAAAWTFLGQDTRVQGAGANVAAPVRVRGARLKAGQTYGFYVSKNSETGTFWYTNGNTISSNSDLQITPNAGTAFPLFSSSIAGRIFNGRIYYHSATCYANCDGSTNNPLLGASDFVCFLNKFRNGEAYANCDGSTAAPVLSAGDFVCFLNKFRAGCP